MQLNQHLQTGITLFVVALVIGYFAGVYVPFTSYNASPQALSGLNLSWSTAVNGGLKYVYEDNVVVSVNGQDITIAFGADTVVKKLVVNERGTVSEHTITTADLTVGGQVGLLITADADGNISAQEIDLLIPAAQ